MNRVTTKWKAVSTVFWIVAVALILTILPLRLWDEDIVGESNRIEEGVITLEKDSPALEQMFVAQYDRLDGVDILIKNCSEDARFALRVFDENHGLKRTRGHFVSERDMTTGRCFVKLNLVTEVGKPYYYTLECLGGSMELAYEVTETSGFAYSGPCHVGDTALGGCNMITGYHYIQPIRKIQSLLFILGILVVAFVIHTLLKLLGNKKPSWNDVVTLQWGVKRICNPLIVLGTLVGVIACGPLYKFSLQYVDIALFTLGTLMLGLTFWYMVNRTYNREETVSAWDYYKDKLPDYLQSAFIALAIWACIGYMNGLYEVHHDIAYRQMLVWLALAMIVTYGKELLSWWNAGGLVLSAAGAVIYYRMHIGEMQDEFHVQILKWTCYLAVAIVMVAIHTVTLLVQRKIRHINWIYAIPTFAMAAGIVIKRNTRWWPVMMVVAFGLFGLYYAGWDKKNRLLQNVLNGILMNFICCTVFCLWHRPYPSFMATRYPHVFHTVTETAAYLAVVMAAALVKLMWKYNQEENWKACFYEAALFGVTSCYELFTMSRTGLLAVGVMGVVVWLFMMQGSMGKKVRKLAGSAGLVVACVLWFFPICITVQRIVPALVNKPVIYEIETYTEEVLVGEDVQSDEYITMDRFAEVFANKMFSVPVDTFNLYQYRIGPDYTKVPKDGPLNKRPIPVYYDDRNSEVPIDFTNGRTDIFRSYIEQLTMEGHDEMGAILKDGSIAMHAHNIYLQFAFDHGIIMGILYVLWLALTGIWTLVYYYKKRETDPAAALPLAIVALFVAAGMVEWIAHPCNPVGFSFLLILAPLVFDEISLKKKEK